MPKAVSLLLSAALVAAPVTEVRAQHAIDAIIGKLGGRTRDRGETGPESRGQPGSVATSRWPGGNLSITATGGRNDDREEIADRAMRRAAAIARASGKPLIKLSSDGPALGWHQDRTTYAPTPDTKQPFARINQDGSTSYGGEYTVEGSPGGTVLGPRRPQASIVVRLLTEEEAAELVAKEGKSRDQLLIYDAAQFADEIEANAGRR